MKKIIAFLLTFCMLLSLAACKDTSPSSSSKDESSKAVVDETPESKGEDVSTPEDTGTADTEGPLAGVEKLAGYDDPITFKFFLRDPNTAPDKNNPILQKITEMTGVTIEWEFLVGDLDQKLGVMIAGGDYPDAIFAGDSCTKLIDAGAFIPLEDKIKEYPTLWDHYGPHEEKMTAADGHIYILELYGIHDKDKAPPMFQNTASGFYMQKAVIEEAGYKIPKTVNEYFEMIEAYQTKYPEIDGVKTIGFEVLSDGWRAFCQTNPAMHLMGYGNDGNLAVDQTTYEAFTYHTTDTAKAYYKKLNEEYHKGIIEPETFTQSYDQYISRISSGAVLGFFDQQWNFGSAEGLLKNDGKSERTYVSVPLADEGVADSYLDAASGDGTGINGQGITVNCENPDRLLAFFDWLLQEQVQKYLQWGEEGVDYTQRDDGDRELTDARRAINNDTAQKRDKTGDTLWQYTPKRQGLYDDGSPCGPGASVAEYQTNLTDYDKNFLEKCGVEYPAELLSAPTERAKYYPVWAMTITDGSPANVAETKMMDTCHKYLPRIVLSEEGQFDALWNEFVAEVEAGDPSPYLEEVNRQISEIMK